MHFVLYERCTFSGQIIYWLETFLYARMECTQIIYHFCKYFQSIAVFGGLNFLYGSNLVFSGLIQISLSLIKTVLPMYYNSVFERADSSLVINVQDNSNGHLWNAVTIYCP